MKKSIIVMMLAVLLVSALFVSCKQEIATPQDKLGTVSIALPSSRALTPTSQSTIPTVDHWYYVATKTDSGYYKTGETEWASLAAMQAEQQVGNKFSAGEWSFSFYGYASAQTTKPSDPKADAVYYAENIPLTVVAKDDPNYIDVVLQGGSAIPAANVTFGPLTFESSTLPGSYVVKINGEVATFDSQGKCKFTNVAEGDHTYVVTVWTVAGEKIGEAAPVNITVNKGYDYFISGSVEMLDAAGIVKIRDVGYDKGVSASVPAVDGEATVLTVKDVAPLAGEDTTASFAANDLVAGSTYVLETEVKGIEDPSFVVTGDNVPVASIDLTLYKDGAQTTVSGKTVTVTTYIAKGLSNVSVSYNGTGADPTGVSYNEGTGALTFTTSHFSEFNVASTSAAYIPATNTAYDTLEAAVTAAAPGQVIKLLKNLTSTITLAADKSAVLDLNGKSITTTGAAIRNCGTLTIKDSGSTKGEIKSTGSCAIYCLAESTTIIEYAVVKAQEAAVIWPSHDAVVTINGGVFTAIDNFVLGANGNQVNCGNVVTINGGTFNGGITSTGYIACGIYAANNDVITVNDGTFVITNGVGILARAGLVTVNGGSITCTGVSTGWVGDNKNQIPCSALVFDAHASYPGLTDDAKIVINNGVALSTEAADMITVLPNGQYNNRIVDNRTSE